MIDNVRQINIVRKINQELAISGQITPDQLQKLADDGYKSVLNLCFVDKQDFWQDEQEKTQFLGLCYVNLPTKVEYLTHQSANYIFEIINELPKPLLIHCDNSKRSAAIVLLYISTKQGINFEQVWQQAINLDLL
ncbi:beta-lactamase hydrolase domain-containing protein [Anabaena sp. UHCC 0451]|uniref:beta-lactamase hydrolase domain-containing protein n=1 Tax=Anabaena sp. UHCC 0451 TaxID=2055235 RepID=UPI002B218CDC|nr:sulfur transferase domain-containing protein [Anabaena sp. UHCC 0451]MEA5579217.1 sulfur transferase domain-containing protein [Anabaena sp. UHCC 0451]